VRQPGTVRYGSQDSWHHPLSVRGGTCRTCAMCSLSTGVWLKAEGGRLARCGGVAVQTSPVPEFHRSRLQSQAARHPRPRPSSAQRPASPCCGLPWHTGHRTGADNRNITRLSRTRSKMNANPRITTLGRDEGPPLQSPDKRTNGERLALDPCRSLSLISWRVGPLADRFGEGSKASRRPTTRRDWTMPRDDVETGRHSASHASRPANERRGQPGEGVMSGDVWMAQGGGLGLSDWRFVLSVSLSLSSTCPVFSSVRGDWGSVDLRISPPGGVIIDPSGCVFHCLPCLCLSCL
jgi:hypothetical protein